MDKKPVDQYQVEDFVSDESFLNYHLKLNRTAEAFWEAWLSDNPEKEFLVKEAKEIINELSLSLPEEEYNEEFQKLTAVLHDQKQLKVYPLSRDAKQLPTLTRERKIKRGYITASLLLVSVAVSYFIFSTLRTDSKKLIETANNGSSPLVVPLSDSTVVTLEPHSRLLYPKQFKAKERNVYLYGGALFSVKRDVEHPFKVHAQNIVATVLGTVFQIQSPADSAVVVKLLKGKLNVQVFDAGGQPGESVLLYPDEEAVCEVNQQHLIKRSMTAEHFLDFNKSNFEEIASRMKTVYGVTLVNNSSKTNWSFTGEFKNSTAKEVIENICLVKNISFVMRGDTIVIK